jgi:PHD/YefM family antitoxin component YafN of YafNO toxin-antitoxin module
MENILSLNNMLDSLIPISRFNKGEANKIFDEVKESGCKIVVKNNTPTCVLLTPEKYKEMIEMVEEEYLTALVEERERNGTGNVVPADKVYERLGIEADNLDDIPMEYGVDWE